MSELKPVELLAPAGNAEVALAAFDGGADAVYCGLGRFNARLRAENFTPDTLHRVIDFAHNQDKKVYVTLNTLIFESELRALGEHLEVLAKLEPDALIIQDIGIVEIIRKYYPQFKLHASTQMGIHNSAGVAWAARQGFSRVILERQLSLSEIRAIAERAQIELEVFIHGSLCCSLSGQCQWSQQLYGASGNRGVCKQPCRKRFNGKFFFSPDDLCGIDYVASLRELGIASLKIEGRLRAPEYVWKVSRAYRILCDAAPGEEAERRREAEKLLSSASGRRGGKGFFALGSTAQLIEPERSGNFGRQCAKILRSTPTGLAVILKDRLHLGDRVRLVSPRGGEVDGMESFSVTRLFKRHREILCGKSGDEVTIGGKFPAGISGYVFKIGENGFDFSRRVRQLPEPRIPVDLQVEVDSGGIRVTSPQLGAWKWSAEPGFAEAQRRALTADDLQAIFAGGAAEKYRVRECRCRIAGEWFAPVGVLKQLRREFWAAAQAHWQSEAPRHRASDFYRELETPVVPLSGAELPEWVNALELPVFTAENELPKLAALLADAAAAKRPVAATHFHHLEMLRDLPPTPTVASFPLVVANRFAARLLRREGVLAAAAAPELPERTLIELQNNSPIPVELGPVPPLLATRIALREGVYRDDSGREFRVVRSSDGKLSFLRRESWFWRKRSYS